MLLYLHGGGFSVFDVEAHRAFLVGVSRHAFIRVLAVEYRLIPDHPLTVRSVSTCLYRSASSPFILRFQRTQR